LLQHCAYLSSCAPNVIIRIYLTSVPDPG